MPFDPCAGDVVVEIVVRMMERGAAGLTSLAEPKIGALPGLQHEGEILRGERRLWRDHRLTTDTSRRRERLGSGVSIVDRRRVVADVVDLDPNPGRQGHALGDLA